MDHQRYWSKNLLDLIQEGNLGLLRAARKFDPSRGVKFSYYASFWIKAYMLKFIMDNAKLVKIGTTQRQRKLFFNLAREKAKLMAEGFASEPKLLAERLDVREEEVVEMTQRLEGGELSLDAPLGEGSGETYGAFLKDSSVAVEEQLSREEQRVIFAQNLREFRKGLSKREADIFDKRIMAEDPTILKDIGDKYHISKERVRQIQQRIIENLTKRSKDQISNFEEEYTEFQELGPKMANYTGM
jgi:RNA polymerase sigma-32 factor